LTPDSYVETAKELYDGGGGADEYPSYVVIYETLHDICEEQRSIMDNGVDLSVLSSTFGALPRLTEVGLSFCEAIEDDSSLSPFTAGMTTVEDSHEYHLRVVSWQEAARNQIRKLAGDILEVLPDSIQD